jgi:hypothetical protein
LEALIDQLNQRGGKKPSLSFPAPTSTPPNTERGEERESEGKTAGFCWTIGLARDKQEQMEA